MKVQGLRIQPFDPKTATDQEWQTLNPFLDRIHSEIYPDDPNSSLEQRRINWTSIPSTVVRQNWLVWRDDGSEVVARANAGFMKTESNQHLVEFSIEVLPELRRKGIATELLRRIADFTQQHNRTLLITGVSLPAGEAFMQRIGANLGMAAHENQLELSDLNRGLIRDWQARAKERAQGFELGLWEGPYPEAELETIVAMSKVMNTAPRDDLNVEDFIATPDLIREGDAAMVKRGDERWTMYAREKATGAIAGFTGMFWSKQNPEVAFQGDTGVFPQYRNLGLGRWLKAAMLEKLLRERPYVKRVRTGNADSNAPMLKINHELGFKPYKTYSGWQIELDRLNEYLQQRNHNALGENLRAGE